MCGLVVVYLFVCEFFLLDCRCEYVSVCGSYKLYFFVCVCDGPSGFIY